MSNSRRLLISHAVRLYLRFPLGLRMVEEMLAGRGIVVSHETVRQWARKFGQEFACQIRRRLPCAGDKWHFEEVVLKIAGVTQSLWRVPTCAIPATRLNPQLNALSPQQDPSI